MMNARKLKITSLVNAILLFFFMVLTGCVPKASGPVFQMKENVPDNKAVIYFYRPHKVLGAALANMAIVDNDSIICNNVLMNGYCVYIADPGKHKLHTKSGVIDKITEIEIKPGDKLYFKAIHRCGVWACSYSLNLVKEDEAIKEIASYKLQK